MSIEKSEFGRLANGTAVECYTLKNRNGMSAEFLTYGCRIAKLCVPDRNGKSENVVLGHDTLAEYEAPGNVLGALVGRYANRISGAQFTVGGKTYSLTKNEGNNSLHSAPGGYQDKVWNVKGSGEGDEPSITFAYHSPDGECGFPGNVDVEVTYTVTSDNALKIDYFAKTDAETPLNLTNHSYFNITGDAAKDILSLEMQINAENTMESDDSLIPTGKFLPVEGTPFDFRKAKAIGQDIGANEHSLRNCGGYDHNFVLSGSGVRKVAELYDAASGRRMLVSTDLPGIQVYTANSFGEGMKGNGGVPLKAHHAVCLETQHYPDSVNHPDFPYENLKPGKPFHSTTIYKFTAE
ncbi:MAG TPA: aldose epimerase family protein [Caproicibacter sp.]|nr:aldose epimerase family protein [Caproicibacter sp.]